MELLDPLVLFFFLALSSSEDETMVYLVDGMVVDEAVDGIVVDKEVDNRAVKQGVFKWVLLAGKSVIGFNKLLLLRILIISNL